MQDEILGRSGKARRSVPEGRGGPATALEQDTRDQPVYLA